MLPRRSATVGPRVPRPAAAPVRRRRAAADPAVAGPQLLLVGRHHRHGLRRARTTTSRCSPRDDVFWTAFGNALGYLAICLVLQLGGALAVAGLLTALPRARELVKTLYLLPAVISTVAIAFLFVRIYSLEPVGPAQPAARTGSGWTSSQTAWLSNVRHRARGRVDPRGLAVHRALHAHHLRRADRGAARNSRRPRAWTAPRGGRSSGGSASPTSARCGSRRRSWPPRTRCADSTSPTC